MGEHLVLFNIGGKEMKKMDEMETYEGIWLVLAIALLYWYFVIDYILPRHDKMKRHYPIFTKLLSQFEDGDFI